MIYIIRTWSTIPEAIMDQKRPYNDIPNGDTAPVPPVSGDTVPLPATGQRTPAPETDKAAPENGAHDLVFGKMNK